MHILVSVLFFLVMVFLMSLVWTSSRGAPWVPTSRAVVLEMLRLAGLKSGEILYDLGSGDGRVLILAARRFGASEVVDPRPFAVGSILATYEKYPTTGEVLPAMGYGEAQMKELEETVNRSDVDLVLIGTPIDLGRLMKIDKPSQRVRYELQEIGQPTLADLLGQRFGA